MIYNFGIRYSIDSHNSVSKKSIREISEIKMVDKCVLYLIDIEGFLLDTRCNKIRRSRVLRKATRYEGIVDNPYIIKNDLYESYIEYIYIRRKEADKLKRWRKLREMRGRPLTKQEKEQEERSYRKLTMDPENELIKYMIFMGSEIVNVMHSIGIIKKYWITTPRILDLNVIQSVRFKMQHTEDVLHYYMNSIIYKMKELLMERFRKKLQLKNINNIFEKYIVPFKKRHNIFITGLKFDGFFNNFEFIKYKNNVFYNLLGYKSFLNKRRRSLVSNDVLERDVRRTSIWGNLFTDRRSTFNGRKVLKLPVIFKQYVLESRVLYRKKNGGFFANVCRSLFYLHNSVTLKLHKFGIKEMYTKQLKAVIFKNALDLYRRVPFNLEMFLQESLREKFIKFLGKFIIIISTTMRYYFLRLLAIGNNFFVFRGMYLFRYINSIKKMLVKMKLLLENLNSMGVANSLEFSKIQAHRECHYIYIRKFIILQLETWFCKISMKDYPVNGRLLLAFNVFEKIKRTLLKRFLFKKKLMYYSVKNNRKIDMRVDKFVHEFFKVTEVIRVKQVKIIKLLRRLRTGRKLRYKKYLRFLSFLRYRILQKGHLGKVFKQIGMFKGIGGIICKFLKRSGSKELFTMYRKIFKIKQDFLSKKFMFLQAPEIKFFEQNVRHRRLLVRKSALLMKLRALAMCNAYIGVVRYKLFLPLESYRKLNIKIAE